MLCHLITEWHIVSIRVITASNFYAKFNERHICEITLKVATAAKTNFYDSKLGFITVLAVKLNFCC